MHSPGFVDIDGSSSPFFFRSGEPGRDLRCEAIPVARDRKDGNGHSHWLRWQSGREKNENTTCGHQHCIRCIRLLANPPRPKRGLRFSLICHVPPSYLGHTSFSLSLSLSCRRSSSSRLCAPSLRRSISDAVFRVSTVAFANRGWSLKWYSVSCAAAMMMMM